MVMSLDEAAWAVRELMGRSARQDLPDEEVARLDRDAWMEKLNSFLTPDKVMFLEALAGITSGALVFDLTMEEVACDGEACSDRGGADPS